ncbi:MAG: hypothetical protein AVDCRST_MAG49-691, partial [uncultured Thermomicrobiales bacterium]
CRGVPTLRTTRPPAAFRVSARSPGGEQSPRSPLGARPGRRWAGLSGPPAVRPAGRDGICLARSGTVAPRVRGAAPSPRH